MSEWIESTLDEEYDFKSGLSKSRDQFGFGEGFVSFKDVFYNYFLPQKLGELANTNEKEQEACSVKRGDVFLTRTSETFNELGMSSVALKDYEKATFNGFTKRLRPKPNSKIWPEFVGYYFRSSYFRSLVTSMATMTTRASLNNEILSKLKVKYPPLSEQKAIAHILGTLDDKIELNRQMNQTLEAMAQALFKSWFVDFDPVIDNAIQAGNDIPEELQAKAKKRKGLSNSKKLLSTNPSLAAQFPDSFIFNEVIGKWVPKGWEDVSIYNLIEIKYGAPFSSNLFNSSGEGMPVIRIRDLKTGTPQNWSTEIHPKGILIERGDVIVGMDAEFRPCIWFGERGYLNQRLFRASGKTDFLSNYFIYYSLEPLLAYEEQAQVGTTVAHIGKKDIDKFRIIDPGKMILKEFFNLSEPVLKSYILNQTQLSTLTQLRDRLLPELISGRVRVPVEKNVNGF